MNDGNEEGGEDMFLPPLRETEGLRDVKEVQFKLFKEPSPTHGNSSSGSSDESGNDEYHQGLMGSTPPHAERLNKTSRRVRKQRKSVSPYYPVKYREKLTDFSQSRAKSADWSPAAFSSPYEDKQRRRHTFSDITSKKPPPHGYGSYASFEGKKKKKKERKQDRDEKDYQRKGHQPLQLQFPSTSDPIPNVNILSPDDKPPSSRSDNIIGFHLNSPPPLLPQRPTLMSSLTTHHLTGIKSDYDTRPRVERSHSDAQLSLTLSSSQSIRCPSERNKFFKNFRKTLSVLSKRQQQGLLTTMPNAGFHMPRQHSENLSGENPFGHVFEQIWVELRAWQMGRTVEEQEDWDFEHHGEVGMVLNKIIDYRFDPHSEELDNRLFAGTDREREEYEELSSLRSTSTTNNLNTGRELEECIKEEETTPKSSIMADTYSKQLYPPDDDDDGPKTLTQQGSTDSESSDLSGSSVEYSVNQFLTPEQRSALSEVKKLLKELENVEYLYSTSKRMGDENHKYRQCFFRRKRDALLLWVKVTEGLADHLSRLSKWFGVAIISRSSSIHTPCTPSRSSSDNPSQHPLSSLVGSDSGSYIDPEASLGGLSRFNSVYLSQSSHLSSTSSRGTFSRLFSPRVPSTTEFSSHSQYKGYRKFVDRALKKKGLEVLITELFRFVQPIFRIAEEAIKVRVEELEEGYEEDDEGEEGEGLNFANESWPLLPVYLKSEGNSRVSRMTSTTPRCWIDEFLQMNLPSFSELYIQLARVTVDVMQECMRQKTEVNKSIKPSAYSIRKLIQECHLTISWGVKVRSFYRKKAHLLIRNNPGSQDLVDADMATYESDLKEMLQLYFSYVRQLVNVIGTYRDPLDEEWIAAKEICTEITNGEVEAGLCFSHLASELIDKLQEDLKSQIDKCCDTLHERSLQESERQKQLFVESCREFKQVVVHAREGAMKALGFAKTLMKDLEIAAEFGIRGSPSELLQVLKSSDHVQVIIPQQKGCMLFVPQQIADKQPEIHELLGVSFGRSPSNGGDHPHAAGIGSPEICYLLVVKFSSVDSLPIWSGQTINLDPSAENIVSMCEMQVEGIKMIVRDSQQLDTCRISFYSSVGGVVEIANEKTSSHQSVAERISDLKHVVCRFAHSLIDVVERINSNLSDEEMCEREDVVQHYQSTMHTCYNLAFEYIKEVTRLLGEEFVHQMMGVEMLTFAQHWMIFVTTKCPRGYGKIPRWSTQGLDYLLLACTPRVLANMSHVRYEALKKQMEKSLDHLVGEATPSLSRGSSFEVYPSVFSLVGGVPNRPTSWQRPGSKGRKRISTRALSLQSPGMLHHSPLVHPKANHDVILEIDGPSPPISSDSINSSGIDSPDHNGRENPLRSPAFASMNPYNGSVERIDSVLQGYYNDPMFNVAASCRDGSMAEFEEKREKKRQEILMKCKELDECREGCLREKGVIGRELKGVSSTPLELGKLSSIKQAHFNWRRGRKLGEGQFGRVYECFNLDKGEVNAVKMISLVEKSHNKIRDILGEIKVFLTINHPNIVHLYGVEIHHAELYLFMEYCNQGTLWSASRQGLPEKMIRLYTRDILRAVDALHEKGIVHRDIKSANIFLSDDSIKLGDFGLSIQLRNLNKTAPQEIKDQRGTIPYMAPEVVLKQDMGRPMDVWSIACVVVEMITSKHPWFECDDNPFAIMYQLGQGKAPPYPKEKINSETKEFLELCFITDANERANTTRLLAHPFVQVTDDDED